MLEPTLQIAEVVVCNIAKLRSSTQIRRHGGIGVLQFTLV